MQIKKVLFFSVEVVDCCGKVTKTDGFCEWEFDQINIESTKEFRSYLSKIVNEYCGDGKVLINSLSVIHEEVVKDE